jgi:hypothetical protein
MKKNHFRWRQSKLNSRKFDSLIMSASEICKGFPQLASQTKFHLTK